ncbi:MAG: RNA 2'-phosphotransferase [Deltaproteobacteria bacterium]|nr:RNA 2'-phosphotransferase [Deltaproteobacteria bacterium]
MRTDESVVRASKKLSWLLRHAKPSDQGAVARDAAGWATVSDVLQATGLTRELLERVVRDNDKQRFELSGESIRAAQGHSRESADSTELEASWERYRSSDSVWHGTRVSAAFAIAESGISAMNRTHVHLAPSPESIVGKRSGVDILLEVSPERLRSKGIELFKSPNGVILCRSVPSGCIIGLRTLTRAGERNEARLLDAFGF